MKRTKLFKSLLVAAGLCVGASAWAATGDVTTNLDIDFSNDIVSSSSSPKYSISGTVGSMTWDNQWTVTPNIQDSILRFGNFTGVATLQNNSIKAKDVVTISFEMAFGKLNGKHVGFILSDTEGAAMLTQYFDAYNGDFDDNNPLNLSWDGMYRGSNTVIQERCVYFTITLNYETKAITTNTKCYMSGTGKAATEKTFNSSMSSSNPLGSFAITGNINNADRYSTLDNLKITTTEGDYTAATADYTVNWVCDETVVKTETRNGDVGSDIILLSSDKESFTVEGQKYIYVSDNASNKTVAEDGTTVVTITIREAKILTYYVKAFEGSNELMTISTDTIVEGETASYGYPQYLAVNGVLYKSNAQSSNPWWGESYTITENNSVRGFQYSKEGNESIVFCSEAEDIPGLTVVSGGNTDIRASNRKGAYATEETTITSLEPGIYRVFGATYGNAGTTFNLKAGDATVFTVTTNGNPVHTVGNAFLVTETTNLVLLPAGNGGNSPKSMDYIIVQKAGEIYETMSIVGDFSEGAWDATQGIEMTRDEENPFVWTAVVKDYIVTSSNYSYNYKAVANQDYNVYELPSGFNNYKNYDFDYDGAREGKYTLTFTVNTQSHSVELAIEKQPTATVYFINTNNWPAANIKIYVWNDTWNNGWNTETMTATGEQIDGKDVYLWSNYTLNDPTSLIISNNGSDTERTGDQPFVNGATYKADGSSTVTKAISTAGYATFCSSRALDFSTATGLKAYIAKKNGSEVTFTEVTKVPANTGVLLKGNAGEYTISSTWDTTDDVTGNVLIGVTEKTVVNKKGIFVLMNGGQGVGFYKTTAESFTVGANTAYIDAMPEPEGDGARTFIGFDFDNTTTAIEGVATVKENNGEIYNLQGQRVMKAQKGLYIINGKKVLVK